MNIADLRARGKAALGGVPRRVRVALVLAVAVFAGFGFGVVVGKGARAETLVRTTLPGADAPEPVVAAEGGSVYCVPWCGGADRISSVHKIWFNSVEDAAAHGYAPAKGCSGL